jgi:hypothetical protein
VIWLWLIEFKSQLKAPLFHSVSSSILIIKHHRARLILGQLTHNSELFEFVLIPVKMSNKVSG